MTTWNNSVLAAAAIAGITAGVQSGQDAGQNTAGASGSTPAVTERAAILAAATAVDAAIPNDTSISVTVTGVLEVTYFDTGAFGTAAQLIPFFEKPLLLKELCEAAFEGKSLQSGGDYTKVAAGIALAYTAAVAQMPTS